MGSIGTRRPCCLCHRPQRETERKADENRNSSSQGHCSAGRHDGAHRGSVFDPASELGLAREDVTDRTTSVYLAPQGLSDSVSISTSRGLTRHPPWRTPRTSSTSCAKLIVAPNRSHALADPRSAL